MADLAVNQFALGEDPDAYVFGRGCPVAVTDFDPAGFGDLTAGDKTAPGTNGTRFGRDTRAGKVLTFEMSVNTEDPATGRATWQAITSRWDAEAVRALPGAVVPLRMRLPGSAALRLYGRPRSLTPANTKLIRAGRVDLVADFQAAENSTFYADAEKSLTLSLLPNLSDGGISFPLDFPLSFVAGSEARPQGAVNAGDTATWPVIEIHGPVTNPAIEFVGTGLVLTLSTVLAFDQVATIDTRPWVAAVTRQDGASLAGALVGPRLAEFRLPVGATTVAFRGIDLTGTSSCVVRWRDAYSTP